MNTRTHIHGRLSLALSTALFGVGGLAIASPDPTEVPVDELSVQAEREAMSFESSADVAVSGDPGTQTTLDEDPDASDDVLAASSQPEDAFASTAGEEGFSSGATAGNAEQRFGELDADGSGTLDREELAEVDALASEFDAYDINGDGSIAENEYQSWYAASGTPEVDDTAIASGEVEEEEEEEEE